MAVADKVKSIRRGATRRRREEVTPDASFVTTWAPTRSTPSSSSWQFEEEFGIEIPR